MQDGLDSRIGEMTRLMTASPVRVTRRNVSISQVLHDEAAAYGLPALESLVSSARATIRTIEKRVDRSRVHTMLRGLLAD